jgi:hypothetical protein
MKSYLPNMPILPAEDDENDILLLERAVEEAKLANLLMGVRNGQEAIGYLDAEGAFAD